MFEEEGFGVLVKVDVAELNDPVVVKDGWKVCDGNWAVNYIDFVASDLSRIESYSCGGGPGAYEKVASRESRRLSGLRAGHIS